MSKLSVLTLGDSLAFPSPAHSVTIKHTWPYLIAENLGYFAVFRNNGGSNTIQVLQELNSSHYYTSQLGEPSFDIAIVQVGIVDVTPRLLPVFISKLLNLTTVTRLFSQKLVRSKTLYKMKNKSWINKTDFESNVKNICTHLHYLARDFVFIAIAPPHNYLLDNVGDFSRRVTDYNKIIDTVSSGKIVYPYNTLNQELLFLPDGHHLSVAGHSEVFTELKKWAFWPHS